MRLLRKPFQHTQALVIQETKGQIKEDIITLMDGCYGLTHDDLADKLCQIVVDNFKRLEDK